VKILSQFKIQEMNLKEVNGNWNDQEGKLQQKLVVLVV